MPVELPLHILFVEDVPADAELAARELQRSGLEFSWARVDSGPAFLDALAARCPELIISDYALPGFSGLEALSLSITHCPQLPFVFLTGSSNDDAALACFRAGAWGYVLKTEVSQLPFAVRDVLTRGRALADAAAAREALRESERRYRTLADSVRALIWTSGPEGMRDDVNQPWLAFTGRTLEQELGDGWSDRVHPDDLGRCLGVYATSGDRGAPFSVNYRLRRHDGEYRSIQEHGTPRYDNRERFLGYIGQCLDVTELLRAEQERRRLEAGLAQAQKMEAVGRLASAISHDLNNLLTGILGFCDLLLASMPPDSPHRPDVIQIQTVAQRASPLTRQLQAFIRRHTFPHLRLNLTTLVSELRKPLRTVVRENIELVWELAPDLDDIEGDPGQIEQALYNLVTNAVDAMPDAGRLTVRTAEVTLDDDFVAARPGARTGRHVALSVADTGTAIEPHLLPLLFESPFATMAPSEGSGLGLAAVSAIVRQCGGAVAVASDAGRGSTFTMYFPVPGADAAAAAPADTSSGAIARGSETILVVEDDEVLRRLLRQALEESGYAVLEAVDGHDAVSRWQHDARPIDLLLTDVVMPGRSGLDVARQIRESRPGLLVIFMSGHVDPALFSGLVLDDGTSIIQKPFLPHALVRLVRQLLDRRAPGPATSRS